MIEMHIALVGDYSRDSHTIGGGVESVMLYLAQGLSAFPDISLDVVTLDRWGLGARSVENGRVRVHYVEASQLPGRLAHSDNINRMRDFLVALKPDLVHAHIAGKYSAAAAASGMPWVLTLHGIRYLEAQLRTGFRNRLYRNTLVRREEMRGVRQASHLISISPFIQASFGKNIRAKVYDIENPIADVYFDLESSPEAQQLLYVGRLTPRKAIDVLLKAFRQVHEHFPGATLRLAGKCDSDTQDPYCESLKRFVEENQLQGAVQFLGQLNEAQLHKEYQSCTALVLTAVLETAPMAIAQAMAVGVPVVTTDAGGSRYLVDDGRSGSVVPINDSRAIAQALETLLADPGKASEYGRQAKQSAKQRFHTDAVAARTRDVYYDILGKISPDVS